MTSVSAEDPVPFLGVGIGLRVPHYEEILSSKPDIDFFEIISENFMVEGGRPLWILDQILERYPVVQHGVALYPGNSKGVDREHLRRLKKLVRRTGTPWLTEHLCWGSVGGLVSHDLLPLPYTREAIDIVSENLRITQDYLEIPIAIENLSSYTEFKYSEMPEWDFVAEVAEKADVGILLDVNNIYVSAVNHRFDPKEYLDAMDAKRIFQIHIAGHSHYERFVIDTHDHPVIEPVWEIYADAMQRFGAPTTLLEWDARIPSLEETWAEAKKAESYLPAQKLFDLRKKELLA